MIFSRNIFDYLFILSLSFIIAFISWDDLRKNTSIDRNNYYNYFSYGVDRFTYIDLNGFMDYIKHEWFWDFSIRYLTNFLDLNLIFSLITFLSFFIYSCFVYKKTNILYVLFLLNPLILDLIYSQLRISLASTFFLISIIVFNRSVLFSLFFILLSVLTHTAMFPISLIYIYLVYICKMDIDIRIKIFIAIICGFAFSFVLGPLINIILSFIGDRREGYDLSSLSSTYLYLSFWFLLIFFVIIQAKNKFFLLRVNKSIVLFALSILAFIFMNFFVGGYSTRVIAISMPFLIILIYNFSYYYKIYISFFYFLYLLFYFYIWW
ncbi:hypothetical protein [Acinetobacter indicus]|uniref:hypothetical protein n=1 Tax=Acinetobacter indicus TaxID=756892 RepID=UPI001443C584|nr:hypothetical protein [Acinetobacter indicus]